MRTMMETNSQVARSDDAYQSGQRFLDSSAPRLKRQFAFCETAAGDITSPTAGKDEKPFREFEGSALIGGEAAVPFDLDDAGIRLLAEFFLLLDSWERNVHAKAM